MGCRVNGNLWRLCGKLGRRYSLGASRQRCDNSIMTYIHKVVNEGMMEVSLDHIESYWKCHGM